MILIDIPARTISLLVDKDVLASRSPAVLPDRNLSGILARFEDLADSAANGASMNHVKVCRI
jgi:dihydroxyacid dehydratase/phosphogluconate dehydratase